MTEAGLLRRTSRKNVVLGGATALLVAAILVAAILGGSLLPPQYKAALHTRGRFHSWMHVVAFGALAFAAARSTRSSLSRVLYFLGALAFGFGIEVMEHMIYRAALEWRDVLADFVGISVATLFALLLDR